MTLFLTLILWIVSIAGPQRLWWWLVAWMYRHPDMVEPSDAFYNVIRSVATVAALIGLIASLITYCALPESEQDVLSATPAATLSASHPIN